MTAFARQEIIAGWEQDAIGAARVLVYGRDWPGCFAVWALSSLGVLEVLWLGEPGRTESFGAFLARDHAPGLNTLLCEYPLEPRRPEELAWIVNQAPPRVIIACSDGPARDLLAQTAAAQGIPFLDVSCAAYGSGSGRNDPAPAMMAAALAADEFRQIVNPLPALSEREFGAFSLASARVDRPGQVLLAGAGGIGVYCAVLLAAVGVPLALVDADYVELTNLNRQGLFTVRDATLARPKAEAAAERLRGLFPRCPILSEVVRVDAQWGHTLKHLAPTAIVSAVDNAATRLVLGGMGERLGVPVVQAGTDVFSADCFVQEATGPSLDVQMRGALSDAARSEGARSGGGCAANPSYVVPGMVAGAFAAARTLAVLSGAGGLPSLHWRSGVLPRERREIHDEFASAAF